MPVPPIQLSPASGITSDLAAVSGSQVEWLVVLPRKGKRIAARRFTLTRGFTLLELLVVMVIAGIVLGAVTLNAMPDSQRSLQEDAQRIALLLQLARDEAIVRNRPLAFEADARRYRFLLREGSTWQVLEQDDLLRERAFRQAPVALSIHPAAPGQTAPLRIVFGREPVGQPFVLTLAADAAQATIRADGIGHFVVE